MTTGEIVQALNAKRCGKGKWEARCTAHDDRSKNTLKIAEGKKGVVLKCMAGCDTRDVMAKAGLRMRDLFATSRDVTSAELRAILRQRRIDAAYEHEQLRQAYRMVYRAFTRPIIGPLPDALWGCVDRLTIKPVESVAPDRSWWPYLWPQKLAHKVGIDYRIALREEKEARLDRQRDAPLPPLPL